jgi:hypothetical protein
MFYSPKHSLMSDVQYWALNTHPSADAVSQMYDEVDLLNEELSHDEWTNFPNQPYVSDSSRPDTSTLGEWLITNEQRDLIQQYYAFMGYYFYHRITPQNLLNPDGDIGIGIIAVDNDTTKVIQVVFANGFRGDERLKNKLNAGMDYISKKIIPHLPKGINVEQIIVVDSILNSKVEWAKVITMGTFYRDVLCNEIPHLEQEDWGWLKLRYDKLHIAFETIASIKNDY